MRDAAPASILTLLECPVFPVRSLAAARRHAQRRNPADLAEHRWRRLRGIGWILLDPEGSVRLGRRVVAAAALRGALTDARCRRLICRSWAWPRWCVDVAVATDYGCDRYRWLRPRWVPWAGWRLVGCCPAATDPPAPMRISVEQLTAAAARDPAHCLAGNLARAVLSDGNGRRVDARPRRARWRSWTTGAAGLLMAGAGVVGLIRWSWMELAQEVGAVVRTVEPMGTPLGELERLSQTVTLRGPNPNLDALLHAWREVRQADAVVERLEFGRIGWSLTIRGATPELPHHANWSMDLRQEAGVMRAVLSGSAAPPQTPLRNSRPAVSEILSQVRRAGAEIISYRSAAGILDLQFRHTASQAVAALAAIGVWPVRQLTSAVEATRWITHLTMEVQ